LKKDNKKNSFSEIKALAVFKNRHGNKQTGEKIEIAPRAMKAELNREKHALRATFIQLSDINM